MKRAYEEAYLKAEESHPWFVARRALFSSLLAGPKDQKILDGGCGSGIFLSHLRTLGYEKVEGFEPSPPLRDASRQRSAITVHRRFPSGIYDSIFLLDVLEHVEDDGEMLRTVLAHLREGGRLYFSVPAHPSLWSSHDEINMHLRRYTRKGLRRLLLETGFQVDKLSYWNMLLFPPAALRRLLWKSAGSLGVGRALSPLGALAGLALRLENAVVLKASLPMGLSLVGVARKGDAETGETGAAGSAHVAQ